MENCINDAEVSASLYAGGIAGWSSRYIRKCTNNGSLENNSACAGGIAGYNSFEVSDCVNYGSIGKPNLAHTVGGICGEAKEMIISNCENYGTVYGILQIGGIAGNITEPEWADGYMDSCSNYGMIIAAESSSKIGGICGNGNGNIINCINSGDISVGKSSMYIGGIGGDLGNVYTLVNCINTGKITGTGAMYVGGIAGKIYGSSFGNCVSTGALNITNGSYAANIVGEWVSDYYAITNCYALNNNFSADAVAEENCRVISQKSLSTDAPQLTSSVSVGDYTGNDLVQALNALVWREYTESEYYLYYPLCFWKYQDGIWMRAGAVSVKTTEDAVAELLTVFPLKSGTSLKDYNVLAATYLASGKMQDVIGLDFIDEYDTPTYLEEIDGSSLKFSTFKILILDEKYSPYQPVVTVSGS